MKEVFLQEDCVQERKSYYCVKTCKGRDDVPSFADSVCLLKSFCFCDCLFDVFLLDSRSETELQL